jgi:hypothetical protein
MALLDRPRQARAVLGGHRDEKEPDATDHLLAVAPADGPQTTPLVDAAAVTPAETITSFGMARERCGRPYPSIRAPRDADRGAAPRVASFGFLG